MSTAINLASVEDTDSTPLLEEDQSARPKQTASRRGEEKTMALPKRKLVRWVKFLIMAVVLVSAFVLVKVFVFGGRRVLGLTAPPSSYSIGTEVLYDYRSKLLKFSEDVYEKNLLIDISDEHFASAPDVDSCEEILGKAEIIKRELRSVPVIPRYDRTVCLHWKSKAILVLQAARNVKGSSCYMVNWTADSLVDTLENCIQLDGAHWYGGALLMHDQWPLEDAHIAMQPFTSSPLGVFTKNSAGNSFGPVLERMWLNSEGFGVFVDSEVPLHVSLNTGGDTHLCLRARYGSSRYKPNGGPLSLNYTVCMDRLPKQVQRHMLESFATLPKSSPREELLRDPVWSTRGINMHNLTQTQALQLQGAVRGHKLPNSQFHISGNFTRQLGGIYFDWDRFPNSHQMTSEMTELGFSVSTTIFPFVEIGSDAFTGGKGMDIFVTSRSDQVVGVSWDNKTVALIDFTNPVATKWMNGRIDEFKKQSGVKTFHFHSGEAVMLSGARKTRVPLLNPNDYSTYYVKYAHSLGESTIVGVGYRSQQYGLMVDIGARSSSWGYDLGLKSIIPSVLTLGLMGYPFLLVGPVGGVNTSFNATTNAYALPDRELYIRWLQLSTFLPAFEISVGPWQYDEMVEGIAQDLLKLRSEYIFPILETATKEFLRTGAPLIRPLWWMASADKTAQRIDCEFLVSNRLLVAPILDPGSRERSVYLPKVGNMKWRDKLRDKVYEGGQWVHNFVVELTEIAYFVAE